MLHCLSWLIGLNDKVSGQWSTANGSVISVSPLSGVAEVVGEGTTQGKQILLCSVGSTGQDKFM